MNWQDLGARPPRDLTAARLALHHALQLPALAVGKSLVPRAEDDSHTTLDWRADAQQWTSQPIPETDGLVAGLCPRDMALTLGRGLTPAARRLYLPGITREAALHWLRDGLRSEGVDTAHMRLEPHYELPRHPVADRGDAWRMDILAATTEVGRYFGNADLLLAEAAAGNAEATSIRTWPHHFDLARLLPAGLPEAPFERTVGLGLSPGDSAYAEPYFYVNAYPTPDLDVHRPPLGIGHWHVDGFFAAVLTGTELLSAAAQSFGESSQNDHGLRFFTEAIEAVRVILGNAAG